MQNLSATMTTIIHTSPSLIYHFVSPSKSRIFFKQILAVISKKLRDEIARPEEL